MTIIIIIPKLIFSWMVGGVINSLVSAKFPHVWTTRSALWPLSVTHSLTSHNV